MARPTKYNENIAAKICDLLSSGLSLRAICKRKDIPSRHSVFLWLGKYPEFYDQYTKAREAQAESLFEDIDEIVDTCELDRNAINLAKLRVETKKWCASKLRPKRFGERQAIDTTVQGKVEHTHNHQHHVNIPQRLSVNDWLAHKREQAQLNHQSLTAIEMDGEVASPSNGHQESGNTEEIIEATLIED